jgi:hypothetical protein
MYPGLMLPPDAKNQGILAKRGRLSTIDLFIKVACFVKKENNIINIKRNLNKTS